MEGSFHKAKGKVKEIIGKLRYSFGHNEERCGTVVGADSSGIISEYLSNSCSGIGGPGKRTIIGNGIIPGVFKGRNISLNLEVTNRSIHSHNTRGHHNIPTLVMENLKERVVIKGIKGRMT
jgi:hypothetical protein